MASKLSSNMFIVVKDWKKSLFLLMKTSIDKFLTLKLARLARAITPANEKSRSFSICEGVMEWTILAKWDINEILEMF